jgi:hypothetical protein
MKVLLTIASVCFALIASPAEARKHHPVTSYAVDPGCNVTMPCEGVSYSKQAKRFLNVGFGAAQQSYVPRNGSGHTGSIVSHPSGCPGRQFCGCGASVRVFGRAVRSLYLAANWFRFPRSHPAPGMVAVRRHHVFVLESHLGGNTWMAYDANSGRGMTRIHPRSLAGYTVVNPHG